MPETFCAYPWINVHTNTDGRSKLCCNIYEEDYVREGDKSLVLGLNDFDAIWNGSYMRDVRRKMLAGERVKACGRCYEHEKHGLQSSRQWANQEYLKGTLAKQLRAGDLALETAALPTHLELRLGNLCNLRCNSCWGVSSSSLYQERKKAMESEELPDWIRRQWRHEIESVERFDWDWYKTEKFTAFIAGAAPKLERLYLTGGEPTLIPENLAVLRTILASGNRACHVAWTTNLTHWPQEFYDVLTEFTTAEVQMSLDGYGEAAHYIRYPSRWNVIEKNFQKMLALPDSVALKVYCVVQAWNILDLPRLLDWLTDAARGRRIDFVPLFLEHPDQIHSCVWPEATIEGAIQNLARFAGRQHGDAVGRIVAYLRGAKAKGTPELRQRMREYIAVTDKMRGLEFKRIFPELQAVLDEELQ